MKRVVVTGAAGFIGTNFVRRALARRLDWRIVAYDALTYAGNLENLAGLEDTDRFEFVRGDICDDAAVAVVLREDTWAVINFAAETHVDRSIHGAGAFVRTNVLGTQVLLEASRRHGVQRYLQVSTDEVYGSLGPEGAFNEDSPLAPSSPYSASKAAADLLVRAYHVTHGLPGLVTRCSNNYGPYQFPEKVIPLFITNLLEDRPVPLYGDGLNVRDWIHVQEHCEALLRVLEAGRPGAVYNIGAGNELTNLALTHAILRELGKDRTYIQRVKDRPAHDRRYAVDSRKLRQELGWAPAVDFNAGLRQTVAWYREHERWWRAIKSGAYRRYYEQMYGGRELVEAQPV
ncbi:MAG: dTDP-glucose 4,6-dehydratase [Planctomycetota bacterium]